MDFAYPRPLLQRAEWISLNGTWRFRYDDGREFSKPSEIHGWPLDILVPEDHPLAAEPSLALAQLADSPFLLYQQSFTLNDRLLLACRQAGFTPREVGRSGQAAVLAARVAAGQGVVLLPRIVARPLQRPGLRLVPLREPDLRWDIAFVWRRGA